MQVISQHPHLQATRATRVSACGSNLVARIDFQFRSAVRPSIPSLSCGNGMKRNNIKNTQPLLKTQYIAIIYMPTLTPDQPPQCKYSQSHWSCLGENMLRSFVVLKHYIYIHINSVFVTSGHQMGNRRMQCNPIKSINHRSLLFHADLCVSQTGVEQCMLPYNSLTAVRNQTISAKIHHIHPPLTSRFFLSLRTSLCPQLLSTAWRGDQEDPSEGEQTTKKAQHGRTRPAHDPLPTPPAPHHGGPSRGVVAAAACDVCGVVGCQSSNLVMAAASR